jgi:hypothetical protein
MAITQLEAGGLVEVVAKESTGKFWVINDPTGSTKWCWLDSQYVVLDGDTANLKSFPPPPTPLPPGAPKYLTIYKTCTPNYSGTRRLPWDVTIVLHWDDEATETGYRIFKNGALLATLDADAIRYQDDESVPWFNSGKSLLYEIEAFNHSGAGARAKLPFVAICAPGSP